MGYDSNVGLIPFQNTREIAWGFEKVKKEAPPCFRQAKKVF
jgi:hypothetical protein